jgi:murein DD-endopeptidase MepM/ murein hydrolase activator NlpD
MPATDSKGIITEAAHTYGLDPALLWGVFGTETSFGKNVSTSSAGALGPFQLEPETARSLGVKNPQNLREAAFGGAKYLAQFKGRGVGGMLSAYNAGPAGGYQDSYVKTTLRNAKTYGTAPSAFTQAAPKQSTSAPSTSPVAKVPGVPGVQLDQAAFQQAERRALVGKLIQSTGGGGAANPLFASGLVSTKTPDPQEYMTSAPKTPAPQAGPTPPAAPGTPGKLGGFLPGNAALKVERIDQGQDIATNPGGPILAPGDGVVVAVHNNPGGFGENYPVVRFTSGPLAGRTVYIGHTHTVLKAGDSFKAGQTLSKTGYGTPKEGNARTPGWAEIGLWGPGGPGNMEAGKQIAPLLRRR